MLLPKQAPADFLPFGVLGPCEGRVVLKDFASLLACPDHESRLGAAAQLLAIYPYRDARLGKRGQGATLCLCSVSHRACVF